METKQIETNATLVANIAYIQRDISEIKDSVKNLEGSYVTKTEFEPIKRIVYGLVYILGAATIGSILRLVLR